MLLERLNETVDRLVGVCNSFHKSFENMLELISTNKALSTLRCDRADSGIQAIGSRLNDLETEIQYLKDKVQALQGRQT